MPFRWCGILNALTLEKFGVKIDNCAFLLIFFALFSLYRTQALIFKNQPNLQITKYLQYFLQITLFF